MKLTENKIRKLIRASLKNNSKQQINEAGLAVVFLPALGEALTGLAALTVPQLLSMAGEQAANYGHNHYEKLAYEELKQYFFDSFDKDKIISLLAKIEALMEYNEMCGGPNWIKYELDNFSNDCEFIMTEFERVLGIDFTPSIDAIETAIAAGEGGISVGIAKQLFDERKPKEFKGKIRPNKIMYKGERIKADDLGRYKSASELGGRSLKTLGYVGAVYSMSQIYGIIYKDSFGHDKVLKILNQKDFNGRIKKIEKMYEDMENNKLACKLIDSDISGLPQSFEGD